MSRKHVIKSHKMFDSENIIPSPTSDFTNTKNLDKASIYISWAGATPVGVITIEATNDDPKSTLAIWRVLDFGSPINIAGNTGDHDIIFNELPFQGIRIQVAFTSGTGNITANLTAKTQGS